MKHIRKFNELNSDDIVNQREVIIEPFDNELTNRENYDLDKWSRNRNLDYEELKKLNIYFGNAKGLFGKPVNTNYDFNLNFGGFGREKINFSGIINKKSEYAKGIISQGRSLIEGVYYIISGHIRVSLGPHKGERELNIKFNTIDEIVNFLKEFEDSVEISLK